MPQSTDTYIRVQAGICAGINMVVNPLLAWLGNRSMAYVPLWGDSCIVIDAAITSIIMTVVITLFTVAGTRRALATGGVTDLESMGQEQGMFSRLPRNSWGLGFLLGFGVLLVLVPITIGSFALVGLSGLSFPGFALFKLIYTGIAAFFVTRLVILRCLSDDAQAPRSAA